MSDTSAAIEAYLDSRYRALSPGQRIEMTCGMWGAAVALARAGIAGAAPDLSDSEQRVRLVERLYTGDLAPAVLSGLIVRLRRAG